jgi:hypothetical protein
VPAPFSRLRVTWQTEEFNFCQVCLIIKCICPIGKHNYLLDKWLPRRQSFQSTLWSL